jgi:hypothetical protein
MGANDRERPVPTVDRLAVCRRPGPFGTEPDEEFLIGVKGQRRQIVEGKKAGVGLSTGVAQELSPSPLASEN